MSGIHKVDTTVDVYVLDNEFEDEFIFERCESVIWNEYMSGAGDFELYTPLLSSMIPYIKEDICLRIPQSEVMMFIENWEIDITEDRGIYVRVKGRSVLAWLERRVLSTTYEFKGSVQDTILKLLDEHVINPKDTKRKIPDISYKKSAHTGITSKELTFQATGDNLLDLIISLAAEFKFGVKMGPIINETTRKRSLEFSLFLGEDRSHNQEINEPVIFSNKFDNLISALYTKTVKNEKTAAYIQGEGEYPNRKNATIPGTPTGLKRKELYVDARDISSKLEGDVTIPDADYIKLLEARGVLKLADQLVEEDIEADVEPLASFIFNQDYFIGDIVQVETGVGFDVVAQVTGCITSVNTEGTNIVPTFTILTKGDIN